MADEKKATKVETKKEAVKRQKTLADSIRELGVKFSKNKEDLAKKVFAQQQHLNNTKNIHNREITEASCLVQVNGVNRCITTGVGAKIWQNYEVVDTDTEFRLVLKKTN
jgi:hypothetical protein